MLLVIPVCTRLFSVLQEAFSHKDESRNWFCLSPTLHGFLDNFRWLAKDLVFKLTYITEIITNCHPVTNGVCDAAALGMGSVHFVPTDTKEILLLWWQRFPDWIRQYFCLFANLKGSITNNDLELVRSIAYYTVLAQVADVREKTAYNYYNNIAAVFWQRKGATTILGPAAFLLCLQALHQRFFCYVPLCDYIPSPINAMADFLSQRWDLTNN